MVVAVSDEEIGVDIEKASLCNIDVAKRCFCKNEYEYILSDSIKSDIRFFRIWTKKEAYIKYLGVGLSMPLNSFSVLSDGFEKHSYNFQINSYIISLYSEYELIDYSQIKFSFLNESDIYFFAEQL